MQRHRRRFRRFGGLVVLLLLTIVLFVFWLFSARPVATLKIASPQTLLVLHGPLRPNAPGVVELWERLCQRTEQKSAIAARFLRWLGVPKEVTVIVEDLERPTRSFALAANFSRGSSVLRLLFLVGTVPYRGARYRALGDLTVGVYGGTVLIAATPSLFCLAVDNIHRSTPPALRFAPQLKERSDFAGVLHPRGIADNAEPLPADLAEVRIEIVSADKVRGESFWVCQSEREARVLVHALQRASRNLMERLAAKRLQVVFRSAHKGVFVWWEGEAVGLSSALVP